jgi:hypothetical protein
MVSISRIEKETCTYSVDSRFSGAERERNSGLRGGEESEEAGGEFHDCVGV